MEPFYQEPNSQVYCGHALDVLAELPAESVDCVPTSPPYWGLRSYKTDPVIWGDNHCEHEWGAEALRQFNPQQDCAGGLTTKIIGRGNQGFTQGTSGVASQGNFCLKCGAWKGELGLEPTIDLYIAHLIQIFDEVKRVLKKTGTCWVVIDDSYAGSGKGIGTDRDMCKEAYTDDDIVRTRWPSVEVEAKSLCAIPERFVLAMLDRGWIYRNRICWHKPNAMCESAKDRFTNSWEYVYFFTKSRQYFFDQQFEPYTESLNRWGGSLTKPTDTTCDIEGFYAVQEREGRNRRPNELGRNKRDVWQINTEPTVAYRGIKNFATFPEKLCETPILAGCPSMICKKCGKARERIYEKTGHVNKREPAHQPGNTPTKVDSTGWGPTEIPSGEYTDCGCNAGFEPGVVLDPFAGAGTTGAVAKRLGRKYIGVEISSAYCKLHERRLQAVPLPMVLNCSE